MEERLNKLLAQAGLASRREADELIRAGRVTLNGRVADLGAKADPSKDDVRLDGERLFSAARPYYIALNKPLHCLTTMKDDEGRFCVGDLLRKADVRLFPVGRLDGDSEGLLLLTNDGDFANRVMHPRYEVPKHYLAKVSGKPGTRALLRLRNGVRLEDGPTLPARVEITRHGRQHDWLEISITEGRNRIVRRMCQAVGHPVIKLKRVGVGAVRLGDLAPGEWRRLRPSEVAWVQRLKAGAPQAGAMEQAAPGRPQKKFRRGKGFAKPKRRPTKPGSRKKSTRRSPRRKTGRRR